jgi:hypothetical protein
MRRTPADIWLALPQPFLASEAIAAGRTYDQLRAACEREDLTKLAPALYAVSAGWAELAPAEAHRALCRAAVSSLDQVTLSHLSAAVVPGCPIPRDPWAR